MSPKVTQIMKNLSNYAAIDAELAGRVARFSQIVRHDREMYSNIPCLCNSDAENIKGICNICRYPLRLEAFIAELGIFSSELAFKTLSFMPDVGAQSSLTNDSDSQHAQNGTVPASGRNRGNLEWRNSRR